MHGSGPFQRPKTFQITASAAITSLQTMVRRPTEFIGIVRHGSTGGTISQLPRYKRQLSLKED
jgi:hypothetical protein